MQLFYKATDAILDLQMCTTGEVEGQATCRGDSGACFQGTLQAASRLPGEGQHGLSVKLPCLTQSLQPVLFAPQAARWCWERAKKPP